MDKISFLLNLVILSWLTFTLPVAADVLSQNKAKAYFFVAEEAYDNNNYNDALAALKQVKKLLGKSNDRISALKIKVHYAQNDFIEAEKELNRFFSFKKRNKSREREMSLLLLKVEQGIETQREQLRLKREQAEAARIAEQERQEARRLAKIEKERAEVERQKKIAARKYAEQKNAEDKRKLKRKKSLDRLQFFYEQDAILPTIWSTVIKNSNKHTEQFTSVSAAENNSFVVAGMTSSNNKDMIVRKYNHSGKNEWVYNTKNIGGEEAKQVIVTKDGEYIVVGHGQPKSKKDYNLQAMKFSQSGKVKWNKQYGGKETLELGGDIVKAKDGGYYITGQSYEDKRMSFVTVKINDKGKRKWRKSYNLKENVIPTGTVSTPDSGLLVVGRIQGAGNKMWEVLNKKISKEGWNVWLSKINKKGKMKWSKVLEAPQDSWFDNIVDAKDGNYLLIGAKELDDKGNSTGWIVKIDGNGSVVWDKTYEHLGSVAFTGATLTKDKEVIIVGATSKPGERDGLILKIDALGNTVWSRLAGNDDDNVFSSVAILDNEDVVAAGFYQNAEQHISAWAMKFGESSTSRYVAKKGTSTMGVVVQPMDEELVERYAFDQLYQGLFVSRVEKDSPASKYGVRIGDVITKISDRAFTDVNLFNAWKKELFERGEASIKLNIIREGKPLALDMKFYR